MSISDALAETPVSALDLSRHVTVPVDATVAETVRAMCAAGSSCALVADDGALAGIFTQRDVLMRVVGRPATWGRPITEEMTASVRTVLPEASAADAFEVINDWWVRSVPVVDSDGRIGGNVSYYILMKLIARLVAERISERAVESELAHNLTLMDFTGLPTRPPISVSPDDTVDTAAHHMRARAIGSVLVVDERENLVGLLTEFDLQMQVACVEPDLTRLAVRDVMTAAPVALAARSPIADAVQQMAEHEFSHVPLLGESGRPVGVASFRDIAAFVETSLEALG